VIESKEKPET